jgi:hypothetical protein
MADTKGSALTELAAAPASNDLIPIVDVSDTTMGAGGTTKKIQISNLQSGLGVGDMLLGTAQTVSAAKHFNDGTLGLKGSTSGETILKAFGTAGATTVTIPASNTTLIGYNTTDTLENKTISGTLNTFSNIPFASVLGVAASVHTHAQSDVTNLVTDLAAKAPLASPTFTGTPTVPADAYDATSWNGNNGIPTKDAVRDKIESMSSGGAKQSFTRIVAASGGDHTTLGAAITAASAGDTIYIRSGSYTESAISTALANLTIIGDSSGTVTLAFTTAAMTFSGANLRFENIGVTFTTGVPTFSGDNALINKCKFTKSANGLTSSTRTIIFSGNYGTMSNCQITSTNNASANTLQCDFSGSNNTITGNTITGNVYQNGMCVFSGSGSYVAGNYFSYNGNGAAASAPLVGISQNILFAGNELTSSSVATAIQLIRLTSSTKVVGNRLTGSGSSSTTLVGIKIQAFYAHVAENTIDSCGSGIVADITGNGANIHNNTINGSSTTNSPIGISTDRDYVFLIGNRINACGTGLTTSGNKNVIVGNITITTTTGHTDTSVGSSVANNILV